MKYRKLIDRGLMLRMLAEGGIDFPPLSIRWSPLVPESGGGQYTDAEVETTWGQRTWRFVVQMKASSTPMAVQSAISLVTSCAASRDALPMVIVPYLSSQQMQELERSGVSGIDLCGNGIVMVPDELLVYRSGQPNRFPSSAAIKNIYRKNSSMVSRVFLARPSFGKLSEVWAEVNDRNPLVKFFSRPPMVLSTVSKAVKGLEEDLLVSREKGAIRLIQAAKLLDQLLDNYRPDKDLPVIRRRVNLPTSELPATLLRLGRELNLPICATGLCSVNRYAVMQRGDMLSVYCPRPDVLLSRLPGNESDRFPNLEIVPSEEETDYFDSRVDSETGFFWASPVQTWLELMRGDGRDKETAKQVRSLILNEIGQTT
jgi:hypothetical protein